MENRKTYKIHPLKEGNIVVSVPGSKSITNRALLLAAMGEVRCTLTGVLFSDDSRAFLGCLNELGFELNTDEAGRRVTIQGTGGVIPNKKAAINVGSAGTAARFLPVFLAFAGGDYMLDASLQMRKRPMEPLIGTLREAGVIIECKGEEGHFPFLMHSDGIKTGEMVSNTDVSSQFASAMLMAAPLTESGLTVHLTGSRTNGAYIGITLKMMGQFGFKYERTEDSITVALGHGSGLTEYEVEPDVSAAGYFYAMSPICSRKVKVRGVHLDSMQGDIQFVKALKELGCRIEESDDGIMLHPPAKASYEGIDINMKDFSDQTMTMAIVAAFASSPTSIHGISHIRFQESDRMGAIIDGLGRLGCKCTAIEDDTGILIEPMPMHGAEIDTYEDHRIAMAFALTGLRIPGVIINDPDCCRKTFEDYFEVLDSLCE